MKRSITTLLCMLAVGTCFAQNSIYYKTISLRGEYNSLLKTIPLSNSVKEVLKEFYPGQPITVATLNENPFFKNLFEERSGSSGSPAFIAKGLGSFGSLDITNLADGLARFIVKRTKEELSVSFFEKFRESISKPEYKDAQMLFPQTYATLMAVGDKVYNYKIYINALREAFEADFAGLLPNIQNVIEDPRHADFFKSHIRLKALLQSSIYVGNSLNTKTHPGEIIAAYPVDKFLVSDSLINANGAAKTLQLFSESIKSNNALNYWIDADALGVLGEDAVTLNIYLGLIYQKAEKIKFKDTTLRAVLAKLKELDNPGGILPYLKELQHRADLVTVSLKHIANTDKDKLTFSDYYTFYTASLDLIQHATEINTVPGLEFIKMKETSTVLLQAARAGGYVAMDINRRNYSSAIINIYQLYTLFSSDESMEKTGRIIIKYGSFMADVARAETSEEIETAIEAASLPAGSSRIKRESPFNVSLNAYAGLFGGYERIKGIESKGSKINSVGVSAPIGISISRGHSLFFFGTGKKGWTKNKRSWSSSVLLSVVDIGALTAFRFSNDSIESVPKIQLKDIISPGLFLSIGIPKAPISINVGYQYGPLLHDVSQQANTYKKNYSRLSLSLCVDIPLLNFYTKPKD